MDGAHSVLAEHLSLVALQAEKQRERAPHLSSPVSTFPHHTAHLRNSTCAHLKSSRVLKLSPHQSMNSIWLSSGAATSRCISCTGSMMNPAPIPSWQKHYLQQTGTLQQQTCMRDLWSGSSLPGIAVQDSWPFSARLRRLVAMPVPRHQS